MACVDDQWEDLFPQGVDTEMRGFLTVVTAAHNLAGSTHPVTTVPPDWEAERLPNPIVDASTQLGKRRRSRPARQLVTAVAACGLAAFVGLGAAAAASPAIRSALESVVPPPGLPGITMTEGGKPSSIRPTPPFQVYYPTSMPSALPIVASGQWPWSGLTIGLNCPGGVPGCQGADTNLSDLFPPAAGEQGVPATFAPLAARSIPVVWFARHAILPNQQSIQVVEWQASASPVTQQLNQAVGGIPASVQTTADQTMVTLVKGNTAIQITTNLGVDTATSVARSLDRPALTPSRAKSAKH